MKHNEKNRVVSIIWKYPPFKETRTTSSSRWSAHKTTVSTRKASSPSNPRALFLPLLLVVPEVSGMWDGVIAFWGSKIASREIRYLTSRLTNTGEWKLHVWERMVSNDRKNIILWDLDIWKTSNEVDKIWKLLLTCPTPVQNCEVSMIISNRGTDWDNVWI